MRLAPSSRSIHLLIASFALSTLAACGPKIRFSDSVDNSFDLRLTSRYDDRLHGPYVAGSSFTLYTYDATNDNDLTGWTLVSRDPDVLEIVEQSVGSEDLDDDDKSKKESDLIISRVYAAGEGTAILEVYNDSDEFIRATEIEVLQPDRLELHAAGPLFVRRDGVVPSLVDGTPRILSGGRATFLVNWFKGEQKLNGAGALELASDHEVVGELWPRQTFLDEDRDWMTITMDEGILAEDSVITPVDLLANGELVDTLEFSVVGPEVLDTIEIYGESESGADDEELLVALAQAFDQDGESIWGVAFDWDLNGVEEPGEGDLFRYRFREGTWSTLGAQYGDLRAEAEIQGVEGFVASSNDVSCFCNADPEAPGKNVAFGLLGLAALGLVRRRRAG